MQTIYRVDPHHWPQVECVEVHCVELASYFSIFLRGSTILGIFLSRHKHIEVCIAQTVPTEVDSPNDIPTLSGNCR